MLELDLKRWVVLIVVMGATFIHSSVAQVGRWISIYEEVDEGSFQYSFVRYFAFLSLICLYLPSCYVIEKYGVRVAMGSTIIITSN